MDKSDGLIILMLSAPCNTPSNSTGSYDLGTGSGDGLCEPEYTSSVYDPYPQAHSAYPLFDVADAPWDGDDFESYSHNSTIASANSGPGHIDVTSGILHAKHLQGSQLWKRSWTDTHNFRMLAAGEYQQQRVRWKDGTQAVRVYFDDVHPNAPFYTGAHLFGRYQTENDLYVASFRLDGQIVIKMKHCQDYTTLYQAPYSQGTVNMNTWYDLSLELDGDLIKFYINGQLEASAQDDTLSWGAMGIRLDYTDAYLDDWFLTP